VSGCVGEQVVVRRVAVKLAKVWLHAATDRRVGEAQPEVFSTQECAQWLARCVPGYAGRHDHLKRLIFGNDATKIAAGETSTELEAVEAFLDGKPPSPP
jgi:hypothetical protein